MCTVYELLLYLYTQSDMVKVYVVVHYIFLSPPKSDSHRLAETLLKATLNLNVKHTYRYLTGIKNSMESSNTF